MNKKKILLLVMSSCLLAACGGGGGNSSSSAASSSSVAPSSSSASSASSSTVAPSSSSSTSSEAKAILVAITGDKTVEAGGSITLTATVTNAKDTSVTWSIDDATIATVAAGVVTGLKAGTVKVTATSVEDKTKNASISIAVTEPTLDFAGLITATDNYTIKAVQGETTAEMHVVADGYFLSSFGFGVIIKGEKGYLFSKYDDGKYYYSDKDVATKEDGTTPETVENIKKRISWSGFYDGVGAFAFTGIKDGGALFTANLPSATGLGSFVNSCFPVTDATTGVPTRLDTKIVIALKADKTLKSITITGLKADIVVTVDAIGTTELGVTPVWTLSEGSEAGDGSGEGWND